MKPKEFSEIAVSEKAIDKYLTKREKKKVKIIEYKKLGTGWHGTGYAVDYQVDKEKKQLIFRTLRPGGFAHEYPADRARVFLFQHYLSKMIPQHNVSYDVGGVDMEGDLVSLGDVCDYVQVVERIEGQEYLHDLFRIKEEGLQKKDLARAQRLSDYLLSLHGEKFAGDEEIARSLWKRHIRDAIGHGEMMLGVLDTYPDKISWVKEEELQEVLCLAIKYRDQVKKIKGKLCRMHGDFHPANVFFCDNDKIKILDASREAWGLVADDITAMGINYIWYAVMQTGSFSGPFKELFDVFWNNYLKKCKDGRILETVGLFFAFRSLVVIHPFFYKEQSDETRKKIFNFARSVLEEQEFSSTKINSYLGV